MMAPTVHLKLPPVELPPVELPPVELPPVGTSKGELIRQLRELGEIWEAIL